MHEALHPKGYRAAGKEFRIHGPKNSRFQKIIIAGPSGSARDKMRGISALKFFIVPYRLDFFALELSPPSDGSLFGIGGSA